MKKERFEELLESIREGGAILRGERKPSRAFPIGEPEILEELRTAGDHSGKAADRAPRETSRQGRNGLARFAGTWSAEELKEFEAAIAETEQIDEELWR